MRRSTSCTTLHLSSSDASPTYIKSDNGILLFRADGNGIVHALLRIGMTSLNPSQTFRFLFLFACHDLYLSIAPSVSCLAVFLQHQVQAYGFPPIVQSKVWIFIVICAIIPCFMFTMPTGASNDVTGFNYFSKSVVLPDTNSPRSSLRTDDSPPSLSPACHYSEDKHL